MANQLVKKVEREFIPAIIGTPGTPGGCTEIVNTEKVGSERIGGVFAGEGPTDFSDLIFSQGMSLGQAIESGSGVGVAELLGQTLSFPAGRAPQVVPSQTFRDTFESTVTVVCSPPTPAVAPRAESLQLEAILGWNGGANSLDFLIGAGFARFQFSVGVVGAVVGLVEANNSDAFAETEHAFYAFGNSSVVILERGVQVATVPGVDLSTSPFFYIARDAQGKITYTVPSLGFTHTSATLSVGPKLLDATLFASGDFVDNPGFGKFFSLRDSRDPATPDTPALLTDLGLLVSLNRIKLDDTTFNADPNRLSLNIGLGIGVRVLASIDGKFLVSVTSGLGLGVTANAVGTYPLSLTLGTGIATQLDYDWSRAHPVLPALVAIGAEDETFALGRGTLPALTSRGEHFTPGLTFGVQDAQFPRLQAVGAGTTGGIGNQAAILPAWLAVGGDENGFAEGVGVLPAMISRGIQDIQPPGVAGEFEPVVMLDFYLRPARVYVELLEGLGTDDDLIAIISVLADITDGVGMDDSLSLAQVLLAALQEMVGTDDTTARSRSTEALVDEGVAVFSRSNADELNAIQYALNMDTDGVARYEGYEFLGYACAGNRNFGWKADGLYLLGGDTDAGATLEALVDYGELGSGMRAKHMENVYVGVHTDGRVFLKLAADEGEPRVYQARQRRAVSKLNPGRGITGRQWHIVLEIVDATQIDLDSIEFVLGVSSRRWVR